MTTDVVGVAAHREPGLRREHDLVALARDRAAGDLLGHALAVDVGGVDEVAAGVDEAVDDLLARRLVGLVAEGHRAEAELRDACAGATELAVFHGVLLLIGVAATLRPRDVGLTSAASIGQMTESND